MSKGAARIEASYFEYLDVSEALEAAVRSLRTRTDADGIRRRRNLLSAIAGLDDKYAMDMVSAAEEELRSLTGMGSSGFATLARHRISNGSATPFVRKRLLINVENLRRSRNRYAHGSSTSSFDSPEIVMRQLLALLAE